MLGAYLNSNCNFLPMKLKKMFVFMLKMDLYTDGIVMEVTLDETFADSFKSGETLLQLRKIQII